MLVFLSGCDMPLAQGSAPDTTKLREEVTGLLEPRCGRCHDGTLSTAKPAALAVFDLKDKDWPDGLSEPRLRKLLARFESTGATERERGRVREFVEAELKSRGSKPAR